jgi:hypothetical protein
MTLSQPCRDREKSDFQGVRHSKEPRFVPYEPYKAAITPLTCSKKKHSRGSIASRKSVSPTNNKVVTKNQTTIGILSYMHR